MLHLAETVAAACAYVPCSYLGAPTTLTLTLLVGIASLLVFRRIFLIPLNYKATHEQFQSGATRRRTGNIPPVYPNGWYVRSLERRRRQLRIGPHFSDTAQLLTSLFGR